MTGQFRVANGEFNGLLTKLWKKQPILRPSEHVVGNRPADPIIQSQKVIVNGSNEH